jgi:hypothetical protein
MPHESLAALAAPWSPAARPALAAVGERLGAWAEWAPPTLVRWWLGPWTLVPATRDEALQLVAAGGGTLLLAYAGWAHGAHRATSAQVRGLVMAGAGLLLTAGSSAGLREHAAAGPAVSLAGALLLLRASQVLVRERAAQRERGGPPPG